MFLFRWPKPASLFDRVILPQCAEPPPEICLPATGMILQSDLGRKNIAVNDLSLSFRRLVFDSRGERSAYFYCIWEEGQTSAGSLHKLDWAESNLWRAALTRLERMGGPNATRVARAGNCGVGLCRRARG